VRGKGAISAFSARAGSRGPESECVLIYMNQRRGRYGLPERERKRTRGGGNNVNVQRPAVACCGSSSSFFFLPPPPPGPFSFCARRHMQYPRRAGPQARSCFRARSFSGFISRGRRKAKILWGMGTTGAHYVAKCKRCLNLCHNSVLQLFGLPLICNKRPPLIAKPRMQPRAALVQNTIILFKSRTARARARA